MKTDFTALWIDDNADFIRSVQDPLATWMEDQGFGLIVRAEKSGANIVTAASNAEVELIVLDYKLRGLETGDVLIQQVRSNKCYQDIVFYSQGGIPPGIFSTPPDGVFFVADRTDVKARLKDLISLRIHRVSDLATLRGWIVADSIELESMLGNILSRCFGEKEAMFFERVLEHEGLFDFYKKHQVLSGILKDMIATLNKDRKDTAELVIFKNIIDVFPDEVVHIRNALAHQKAKIVGGENPVVRTRAKGAKELEITAESCAKMRRDLRKHYDNLTKLLEFLKA